MIAIIVIAFLALIGAALTIFLKKRRPSDATGNHVLEPPHFEGLFDRPDAASIV